MMNEMEEFSFKSPRLEPTFLDHRSKQGADSSTSIEPPLPITGAITNDGGGSWASSGLGS